MKPGHVILPVPARIGAVFGFDAITAPAMFDRILAKVEPAITHAPCIKFLLREVNKKSGVACPVGASVDKENIEWFPFVPELDFFSCRPELNTRTAASRASPRGLLPRKEKTADGTYPPFSRIWR